MRGACDDAPEGGRTTLSERRATFDVGAIATNNPGRRLRAPSRKALEAAGQAADEGVQWMTKAKKQEDARKGREKREERKAAAAAGLKIGTVIGNVAGRVESDNVRGLYDESNYGKDAEMPSIKDAPTRQASTTPKHGAVASPPTSLGAACKRSAAVNACTTKSSKKARKESSVPHTTINIKKKDVKEGEEAGERQESEQRGVSVSGDEDDDVPALICESAGCAQEATFGVNGALRYWWVVP